MIKSENDFKVSVVVGYGYLFCDTEREMGHEYFKVIATMESNQPDFGD
ncbi:hypothetical protein C7M37_01103 [Lactiplantibacillus plantarum]|nr:hypothetical protein [Lactiplantibacillus plantarum]MCG0816398.1 hypothetical protein [Lactiplantibacillus plantarum]MCG0819466.1 hypothetical protein [Lactiplantibacillus plantarum]MCG0822672.1 hypothetical protein [Lactiplantibacillus plantarum]MCG0841479.1 hypothetical protein [Lactiplantibacillus plantarum]